MSARHTHLRSVRGTPGRVLGAAALAMLLAGATWAPILVEQEQYDPLHFRANQERWRTYSETRRDELRRQWEVFLAQPEGVRETLVQRMDVVRRMDDTLVRIFGRAPNVGEVEGHLGEIRATFTTWLVGIAAMPDDLGVGGLRTAMEGEIRARIGAFLDELVAAERLDSAERAAIVQQELSLLIRDGLALLATERLRASDGGGAIEVDDADTYAIAERLKAREDAEARAAVAATVDAAEAAKAAPGGRASVLRERPLKLRFVIDLLEAQGRSPAEVSSVVNLPLEELELRLEELLGGD